MSSTERRPTSLGVGCAFASVSHFYNTPDRWRARLSAWCSDRSRRNEEKRVPAYLSAGRQERGRCRKYSLSAVALVAAVTASSASLRYFPDNGVPVAALIDPLQI